MAMLMVDNAVELALKSFLNLHKRQRGGPNVPLESDPSFVALLNGFETCFSEWPGGLRRADLIWYHEVRNLLHHRGNGLTPDEKMLGSYLDATECILRFLFGDPPVDQARLTEDLPRGGATPGSLTPEIIVDIEEMIDRIRSRMGELPVDAAPSLAIPANDLLALSHRASEFIFDFGSELDEETQVQLEPYLEWDPEIEGVPSSPEETIRLLEGLRFGLAMMLT